MTVRILQIDAFADRPFEGNPAAVCLMEVDQTDEWMQLVAAEKNLSETAFVKKLDDGFELRWFTPLAEVDLCGHATLASAHALWTEGLADASEPIRFHTRSGVLTCVRNGGRIQLDFPATPATEVPTPSTANEAFGIEPTFVGQTKFDLLLIVESEEAIRRLKPDFRLLAELNYRGFIVSSQSEGNQFDFVSRFFAPSVGVNEDPVTGSAHCCLGPYWAKQLQKQQLLAYQASRRGGVVHVQVSDERVLLEGSAVTVMRGELFS